MVKTKDSILIDYQNNAEVQTVLIATLKKKLNKIALSRLGLFLTEILIVALMINIGFNAILTGLLVIPVLLFMLLIKNQSKVQLKLDYAERLLWVYQNELNHLVKGENGYNNGELYENERHPYSSDLDIFGQASLYASINRCSTLNGIKILAENLSRPNIKQAIEARQEAVIELTTHIKETFHFRAELQSHKPEELPVIQDKLEHQLPEELRFTHQSFLRAYVKIAPFLSIAALILGFVFGGMAWRILIVLVLFNSAYTFFLLKYINRVYAGFTGSANLLIAFSGAVKWTEDIKWKSAELRSFFNDKEEEVPVSTQIKQLSAIIQSFDARLNFILSAFLNLFFLWDLRCSVRLDEWHKKSSGQLLHGLYRISQFEELISLATLRHNQPDWNFPLLEDSFCFETTALGHPLIREDKRVLNDYILDAIPTVDIVTGSNMAGKSTFLRTVGINMVLAFAGAPVCAKLLKLSIFEVLSYMRIKDSLNDQTSTFKAELNRLKMILDSTGESTNSFVLIDEMLRGTNSKDKYLGSKVFIEKLISQKTPALFATHDLQLSEMKEAYPHQIRNYHFDIQITDGEMHFDYKLKHGACKTFNAALLLKQIGLTLS